MTNSTLEKVARALAVQAGCDPDDPAFVRYPGGEAFGVCWRDKYLEPARAALQSLRQVDDETVEAMADVVWRSFGEVIAYGSSTGTSVAEAAWTAAIDSILGQEP